MTTQGWSLLVSWKDGSSDWMPLKDIKDSYPVQIAEYAMANKIVNEPAFNWWVYTVLRKRNIIVAKVKRYWRQTHKFGIRLPKTVAEALAIDEEIRTDFWRKALAKEMSKVKVTWMVADGVSPEQARTGKELSMIRYQEIQCHVIFDVKMDREKIWFEGGIKTGKDRGKVLIVTQALYEADPDIWIRNSGTHYEMVLVYVVDGILVFAQDPKVTMDELGKLYELKPESGSRAAGMYIPGIVEINHAL